MSELETSFAAVEAAGVVAGRPLLSGASAYRDAAFGRGATAWMRRWARSARRTG